MMYELLYIIPSRFADTEIDGIQQKIGGLIEAAGGKIVRQSSLGKIRLAYPIKQVRHGTYILAYIEAEGAAAKAIDGQLRLTDEVLRHQMLRAEAGALERTWELQSYIAPLSEEDEAEHAARAPRPATAERPRAAAPVVAAPVAVQAAADAAPMSIEELDKKLDEILDEDLTQKA